MKKTRKRVEIIRLEDRVLFDAAAAAAVVEAAAQQNDIQEQQQDQQEQQEQQLQEQQKQQQEQVQEQAQQESAEAAAPQNDENTAVQAESAEDGAADDGAERSDLGEAVDAMSDAEDMNADENSDVGDAEALQESIDAAAAENTDAAIEALINGEDDEDSEETAAPADEDTGTDSAEAQSDEEPELAEEAAGLAPDAENAVEETEHHELAIISSTVADQQVLIDQLADDTDVLVLNDDSDVLDQINEYLDQQNYKYDAVHVLSHGGNGYFSLNNTRIDMQALADDPASFAAIGEHLTSNGDILLYGCNIAAGEEGQAFASQLASLTGADVAASTDKVGLIGGWNLEYSTGSIDVTGFAAEGYNYNMAAYTIGLAKYGTYIDTDTNIYTHASNGQLLLNGTPVANVGTADWVASVDQTGDTVTVDANLTAPHTFTLSANHRIDATTWTLGAHSIVINSDISVFQSSITVTANNITLHGDLSARYGSITLTAAYDFEITGVNTGTSSSPIYNIANITMENGTISLTGNVNFSARGASTTGLGTVTSDGADTLTITSPASFENLAIDTLDVSDDGNFGFNMGGVHVTVADLELDGTMTMDTSDLTISAASIGADGTLNTTAGTVEYDIRPTAADTFTLASGSQYRVILNGNANVSYILPTSLEVSVICGAPGSANDSDGAVLTLDHTIHPDDGTTTFSANYDFSGRDTSFGTAKGLRVTYNNLSGKDVYGGYYYDLTLQDTDTSGENKHAYNIASNVTVSHELEIDDSILFLNINSGTLSTNRLTDTSTSTSLVTYRVASGAKWIFTEMGDAWIAEETQPHISTAAQIHGNINNNGTINFYRDGYTFTGLVTNMDGGTIETSNEHYSSRKYVTFENFSNQLGATVEAYWALRISQMQTSRGGWTNYGTLSYDVNNFGFTDGIDLTLTNAVGATISIHCGDTTADHELTEYVFGTNTSTGTVIRLTNSGTIEANNNGVVVFQDFQEGTGEKAKYIVNKAGNELFLDGVMYFELLETPVLFERSNSPIAKGIYGAITNDGGILNLNTANQQYYGEITTKGVAPGGASAGATSSATLTVYGITNINAKSVFKKDFLANLYSKINVGTANGSDYRSVIQPVVNRWYQNEPAVTTVHNADETKFVGPVNSWDEFNLNADYVVFESYVEAVHKFTVNGNNTEFKRDVTINSSTLEGGTLFTFGTTTVTGTAFGGNIEVKANGTSSITRLLLNSTAKISGELINSGNVTVEHDGVTFNTITNNSSGVFNLNSADNIFNGDISNSGNFYLNDVNPGLSAFSNKSTGYLWINTAASNGTRIDGYLSNRSAFKSMENAGTVTIRGEVDFSGEYNNTVTTNLEWGGVRFLDTITNSGKFMVTRENDAVEEGSTLYVFDGKITNSAIGTFEVLSVSSTGSFPVTFRQKITNKGTVTISTTGNTFDEIDNSGTFDLMTAGNTFDNKITNSSKFYLNTQNTFTAGKSSIVNTGDFQINAAQTGLAGIVFSNNGGTLTVGGDDVALGTVSNAAGATIKVTGANDSFASLTNSGTVEFKGTDTNTYTTIGTLNSSGILDVFGRVSVTDTLTLTYNGTTASEVTIENGAVLVLNKILAPDDYTQSNFTISGSGELHANYDGTDSAWGSMITVQSAFTFKNGASDANISYDNGQHTTFHYLSGEVWIVVDDAWVQEHGNTLTEGETTLPRWYKIMNKVTLTVKSASTTSAFWVTFGGNLVLDNAQAQSGEAWIVEGGETGNMFIDNGGTVTVNANNKTFTTAVYNSGTLTVNGLSDSFADLNNGGTLTVGKGGVLTLTNLSEISGDTVAYTAAAGGTLTFALTGGSALTNGIRGSLSNAGTVNFNTANQKYYGAVTNSSTGTMSTNAAGHFYGTVSNSGKFSAVSGNSAFYSTVTNSDTFTVSAVTMFSGQVTNSKNFVVNAEAIFAKVGNSGTFQIIAAGSSFSDTVSNDGTFTVGASTTFSGKITNTGAFTVAANAAFTGEITNSGTFDIDTEDLGFQKKVTNNSAGTFRINAGNNTFSGDIANSGTMVVARDISGVKFNGAYVNNSGAKLELGGADTLLKKVTNDGIISVTGGLDASESTLGNQIKTLTMNNSGSITVASAGELTLFTVTDAETATMTVYDGGILRFDPSVTQTINSTVNVYGDNGVVYNAAYTTFRELNYIGWIVVKTADDISGYGKYSVASGAEITISGDMKDSLFRVQSGGSLTLNSVSNVSSLANRGGSVTINSGTFGIGDHVENGSGTMTVNGGTFAGDVTNSATMTVSGGTFAGDVTNSATMNVSGGTFSTLTNTGSLTVAGNNLTLPLTNSGTVTVYGLGNNVTLTANTGTVNMNANGTVGGTNGGTINIADGKTVTFRSLDNTNGRALNFGKGSTVNGTLDLGAAKISGSGVTFNNDVTYGSQNVIGGTYKGALYAGYTGIKSGTVVNALGNVELGGNRGILTVSGSNATVSISDNTGILNAGGSGSAVTVWNNTGTLNVKEGITIATLGGENNGMVNIAGTVRDYQMISAASKAVNVEGKITIRSGHADAFSGKITNNGTIDLVAEIPSLNGSITNNGTVNANVANAIDSVFNAVAKSGTINLNAAADLSGKTISAPAVVNVYNTGVEPGNLTNNGKLAFYINKTLTSDITGSGTVVAGSGHTLTLDGSRFTGSYQVDGTLDLAYGGTELAGKIINNGTLSANFVAFTGITSGNGRVMAETGALYTGRNATHIFGGDYRELTVNNNGVLNVDAVVDTLNLNRTLATEKGATLTLTGTANGRGTMAGGEGTVVYDGAKNVLGGTYHNLVFNRYVDPIFKDIEITGNASASQTFKSAGNRAVMFYAPVTYRSGSEQQVMAADYCRTLTMAGSGIKRMESGGTFNVENLNINDGAFVEVTGSGSGRWNLYAENYDIHTARVSDVEALGKTYYLDGTNFQGTNNSANWLVFYSGSNVGETTPGMENANFNALSQYFYQTRQQQMNAHELFSRHEQMESARGVNVGDMAVGSDVSLNASYDLVDFGGGWEGLSLAEDEIGEVMGSADAAADSLDNALAEMLK